MTKRLITMFILTALMLTLATACGGRESSIITSEEAQKIAMEAVGVSADEVTDVHIHAATYDDLACYGIYITVGNVTHECMIAAQTGQVLHTGLSDGAHVH